MRNRTISDVSETSPEFQFYKIFNFGKPSSEEALSIVS